MEPTVCYLAELEVEGYTRTVAWNQEPWSVMGVELTPRLTERVIDTTLDFRQMLSLSNNALEVAYSQESWAVLWQP